MTAYVLVSGRESTRPAEFEAFRIGSVRAVLELSATHFGGPMQVWEMPSQADAQYQADRLQSGWFWACTFKSLLGVQQRLAAIVQNGES